MRVTTFLAGAGAALLLAACAPPSPYRPVATVKQIMEGIIDPAADVVWGSVGTIITVAGVEEIAPKNDAQWERVEHSALTIAETANLLLIGPRAKDQSDWVEMAQALTHAALAAMKAAEARDPEALFSAGGTLYETCRQCHERYPPPPETANQ